MHIQYGVYVCVCGQKCFLCARAAIDYNANGAEEAAARLHGHELGGREAKQEREHCR